MGETQETRIGKPRVEAAESGASDGAPTDSKTRHSAYGEEGPFTALAQDQAAPRQGKDQDAGPGAYDEDGPYEAGEQDVPYGAYDHDTTFEPDDFAPAGPREPDVSRSAEPSPESPSSHSSSPLPWYDDASRSARWAVMKEASDPSETPDPPEPSNQPEPLAAPETAEPPDVPQPPSSQ